MKLKTVMIGMAPAPLFEKGAEPTNGLFNGVINDVDNKQIDQLKESLRMGKEQ